MRAMNRALDRGPRSLRTRRRFDWLVSKINPRHGFVCGRKGHHIIGTPVSRIGPHSAKWHVLAQSGPILLCAGSDSGPLTEPRPLTGTAPLEGRGTDGDPYRRALTGGPDSWKQQCDEFTSGAFDNCVMRFPERSLTGLFASEKPLPAYSCPTLTFNFTGKVIRKWLLESSSEFNPFGTAIPGGVEVRGLWAIGVTIPHDDEVGTLQGDSSATHWLTGTDKYQVVLHCIIDTQ